MREYCVNDLFFLVNFVLSDGQQLHSHYKKPFYYTQGYLDACRQYEQQLLLGGGLDCSCRGSGKSTLRTKACSIYLLLKYPNITIFIFSVERKLARKHLRLIKDELESNKLLKVLFDDILYSSPQEAVKLGETVWSIEEGIRVKRTGPPRSTQTVEHHTFYGGGPIGTRPDVIMADDIESNATVSSPENIMKFDEAFSACISLMTPVAIEKPILFVTNTRFSEAGTVQKIMDKYLAENPVKVRAVPGEDLNSPGDGPLHGTPIYPLTKDDLFQKYDETTSKTEYALQFALSYTAGLSDTLNENSINWYDNRPEDISSSMHIYICIDASRGIYDPTAIWVWGINEYGQYYWLDSLVKKMDPSDPSYYDRIHQLIEKWRVFGKYIVEVRVEQMGGSMWADIISRELRARHCFVKVLACSGIVAKTNRFSTGKAERIFERWAPILHKGKMFFPLSRAKGGCGIIQGRDGDDEDFDIVDYFLNVELRSFPRAKHDDLLDAGALLFDSKANSVSPLSSPSLPMMSRSSTKSRNTSWMSAIGG